VIDARPVEGSFRRLRSGANVVLIAILFATPWIRIAGEPLVLLDIPNRKFHVFGLVIFPQELYFLWLILAATALALFFFTALAGRLWCGWACPQTVFTDVYAGITRRIEGWKGNSPPRHVAPWRRLLKHVVLLALSGIVGFHLAGYFRSPYEMLGGLKNGHYFPTAAGFIAFFTLLSYVDFVFVRQSFCKYICPYARFQGVLFDRDSLVIGYDARRGEPRGKKGEAEGDCVDCGLCVAVCPSGIDIRDGLQLECIACTQCIDACNGVMAQIGREKNLISYASLVRLEGKGSARLLRPRLVVYAALLLSVTAAFGTLLERRLPMDLRVARNDTALYTRMADGRVGNAFTLHIENRARSDQSFRLELADSQDFELIAGMNPIPVPAVGTAEARVFVVPHAGEAPASAAIAFRVAPVDGSTRALRRSARYVAPGANGGH
jgi:cytochrome c oxidase accessory protein FixG